MAKILCIECSTEVCSVCIHEDGVILAIMESKESFQHSKKITVFIERCLQEAALRMKDLDAVAVTSGPGSYTGLRVGTATAKGICFGVDIPLITVPTLQAMAQGYIQDHSPLKEALLFCMLDARRNEVYGALFDGQGLLIKDTFSYIMDEDPYPVDTKKYADVIAIGNGANKAIQLMQDHKIQFSPTYCSATHLIPASISVFQSGTFADLFSFTPAYYKNPNITQSKKKLL